APEGIRVDGRRVPFPCRRRAARRRSHPGRAAAAGGGVPRTRREARRAGARYTELTDAKLNGNCRRLPWRHAAPPAPAAADVGGIPTRHTGGPTRASRLPTCDVRPPPPDARLSRRAQDRRDPLELRLWREPRTARHHAERSPEPGDGAHRTVRLRQIDLP